MKKILLAEDSAVEALVYEDILIKLGCDVIYVKDGAEAFARLQVEQFDGLVTDMSMPHMTGLVLLQAIGRRGTAPPTLLHSTNLDLGDGTYLPDVEHIFGFAKGVLKSPSDSGRTTKYLGDFVASF